MLPEAARGSGAWLADVASGLLFVRQRVEDEGAATRWIAQVRQPAVALRGYATVLGESILCDEPSPAAGIAGALVRRWDPAGVLS